jgi:DNA-binding GntR family transcriptional regulator
MIMMHSIIEVINSYMETLGYNAIVSKKTIAEHEAVLKCLEANDSAQAQKLLEIHIINDEQRLKRGRASGASRT